MGGLGEHGDKLPAGEKATLETALTGAKEALDSDDAERIKAANQTLTAASHKLAEVMYKTEGGGGGGGGTGGSGGGSASGGGGGKDDVIDAEYTDVDA